MPRFFDDISRFYGTGEKNEKGETLEEFLEAYDPYKYKNPCSTTDAVIFSHNLESEEEITSVEQLKVLMIKRGNHPSIGWWAVPGGFVDLRENLEVTARRELEEEAGVKGLRMEHIGAYGDVDRDPRARVITSAYMSLVKESEISVHAGDDAADAVWCNVSLEVMNEEKTKYQLVLKNEEKGLTLSAILERTCTSGLIKERKTRVLESNMITGDHSAIILDALLILESRFADK